MPPSRRRRRQGAGRRRRQTPPTDRRARGFAEVPGPEPASGLRACAEALRGEPLTNRCATKARLRKVFPARAAQWVIAPSGLPTGAGEGPDAPPPSELESRRGSSRLGRTLSRPGLPASSVGGGCRAGRSRSGVDCVGGPGPSGDVLVPVWSSNQPSESMMIWPGLRKRGWCPGRRPPHPALAFGAIHAGAVAAASLPGGTGPGPARSRLSRSVELPWAGWVCKERKHRSLPSSPQILRRLKDPFAVANGN